jgi:hypothetical protein
MRQLNRLRFFAVLLAFALAMPAWAGTVVKNMEIRENVTIAGKSVEKGTYRIEITDEGKLTVKKGKQVVAEGTGKWVERSDRVPGNTFVVEKGAVTEIRIEGQKRNFVLGS